MTQHCADQSIAAPASNNKQSCNLWGAAEFRALGFDPATFTSTQPSISFIPHGSSLPSNVSSGDAASTGLALVSPACKGRVVARAVFKSIQQPQKTSPAAGIRFQPFTDGTWQISESPVIRCLLTLNKTKTHLSEIEQALTSTEDKCWVCDEGNGCPANEGSWYSDAFTFEVPGCNTGLQYPVFMKLMMSPGWKALLAKAEVCNGDGCFDPLYELRKEQSAVKCTAQGC